MLCMSASNLVLASYLTNSTYPCKILHGREFGKELFGTFLKGFLSFWGEVPAGRKESYWCCKRKAAAAGHPPCGAQPISQQPLLECRIRTSCCTAPVTDMSVHAAATSHDLMPSPRRILQGHARHGTHSSLHTHIHT